MATIAPPAPVPSQDTLTSEAEALIAAVEAWTPTPEFLAVLERKLSRVTDVSVAMIAGATDLTAYFR